MPISKLQINTSPRLRTLIKSRVAPGRTMSDQFCVDIERLEDIYAEAREQVNGVFTAEELAVVAAAIRWRSKLAVPILPCKLAAMVYEVIRWNHLSASVLPADVHLQSLHRKLVNLSRVEAAAFIDMVEQGATFPISQDEYYAGKSLLPDTDHNQLSDSPDGQLDNRAAGNAAGVAEHARVSVTDGGTKPTLHGQAQKSPKAPVLNQRD